MPDPDYHPIRAHVAKDGSGVYVKRIEDAEVARSRLVHEAVTLDFDPGGNLVGVEISARPIKGKPD